MYLFYLPVFSGNDFYGICKVLEDNAFFFAFQYFYFISRHFRLCSSVNIICVFCAQPYGGPAAVHGCIPSAYYGHILALQVRRCLVYDRLKKIDTSYNPFCIFSLTTCTCGYPCSYGHQDSIMFLFEFLKGYISSYPCIYFDFYAGFFYKFYFLVKHFFLWKSVLRYTVSEHAATIWHLFIYRYGMPLLAKKICSRKSHGASSYYCDLFACVRFTIRDERITAFCIHICGKTLEPCY